MHKHLRMDVLETLLPYLRIYISYSPAGRSVWGKTVPEVLSTARSRRPRDVLKAEGTVFPYTDRPKLENNIFLFSATFFLKMNPGKLEKKVF